MAEFFIMRKHRRSGIGRRAAAECFNRFPGRWLIHQIPGNEVAAAFWRAVIPVPYEETSDASGITQRFEVLPKRTALKAPGGASRSRSSVGRGRTRVSRRI